MILAHCSRIHSRNPATRGSLSDWLLSWSWSHWCRTRKHSTNSNLGLEVYPTSDYCKHHVVFGSEILRTTPSFCTNAWTRAKPRMLVSKAEWYIMLHLNADVPEYIFEWLIDSIQTHRKLQGSKPKAMGEQQVPSLAIPVCLVRTTLNHWSRTMGTI